MSKLSLSFKIFVFIHLFCILGFGQTGPGTPAPQVYYVDVNTATEGDGSISAPFRTITQGVAAAVSYASTNNPYNVEVWVYPGTYYESDMTFSGYGIKVRANIISENPVNYIIDCGGNGRAFFVQNQIDSSKGAWIEGFTIYNGQNVTNGLGGGVRIENASPTIKNCIIGNSSDPDSSNEANYGAGIYINNGNPILSYCKFYNNSATVFGGGLYCVTGSPVISNCLIGDYNNNDPRPNYASSGGGAYFYQSSPTLQNINIESNIVVGNSSANGKGGGLFFDQCTSGALTDCYVSRNCSNNHGGGLILLGSNIMISGGGIYYNNATYANSNPSGGGVYMLNSQAYFYSSSILYNSTKINGGGLYSKNSFLTLDHCNVSSNNTSSNGGGVYIEGNYNGIQNLIKYSLLSENESSNGGGAYYKYTDVLNLNVNLSDNTASNRGGGIASYDSSFMYRFGVCTDNQAYEGGGIYGVIQGPVVVSSCFYRNKATGGGGMLLEGGSSSNTPYITNCQFYDNEATGTGWGGGILIFESDSTQSCVATIINCLFHYNKAGSGGGLYSLQRGVCNVINSTFANNITTGPGGGTPNGYDIARNTTNTIPLNVTNCICYYSSSGIAGAPISGNNNTITVKHSCIEGGGWIDPSNISVPPLFIDGTGNYRLQTGSPCIDTGDDLAVLPDTYDADADLNTTEDTPDLLWNVRIVPTAVDMGCYEKQPQ